MERFYFLNKNWSFLNKFHIFLFWVVLLFFSNSLFHEACSLSKVLGFVEHLSSSSPPGGDFVSFPQSGSRSLGWGHSISIVIDSVFVFLTGFLLPFEYLFVCLSPMIFLFLLFFPSKSDMHLKVLCFISYIVGCRNGPIHWPYHDLKMLAENSVRVLSC